MSKINYNSLITGAMHRPKSKDGYVLYPKVAGYTGEVEGSTKADQSEIFKKQSAAYYNSPTNIRKVWITGRAVTVQYFAPMVTPKKDGKYIERRAYKDTDLFDIAKHVINRRAEQERYIKEKMIDKNATKPEEYSVSGNILGAITSPYACNNVEEIYLDWTAFLSEDLKPYFQKFNPEVACAQCLAGRTQFKEIADSDKTLYNIFCAFNAGQVKDLRKRFPRLRRVILITRLEEILNHPNCVYPDRHFNEPMTKETWYDANRELIRQSNSICIISKFEGLQLPNLNYTSKENQYKYDQDVLKGVFQAYTQKASDAIRQKQYGTTPTDKNNDDTDETVILAMGPIEAALDKLKSDVGEAAVKYALLSATSGATKKELEEMFSSFTKKNRTSMAKMIGININ